MMPNNHFPLLLRQERRRRGWSQQDVADALKTTRVTVSRWESGNILPALYLRGPLCELFGKRVEEFFPVGDADLMATRSLAEIISVTSGINAANTTQTGSMPATGVIQADHPSEVEGSNDRPPVHESGQDPPSEERDEREASAAEEIRILDAEKRRLEVQVKRLEMQRKRVEYTIDIANRMINVLDPNCDKVVRSLIIEGLLTDLQQPDEEDGQEIPLPTFERVRKALEVARRGKARTKNRQRMQQTPLDVTEAQRAAFPSLGDAPLEPDSGAAIDLSQVRGSLPASFNQHDNVVVAHSVGTARRSVLEKPFHNPYGRLTPILDPQEFVGRVQLVQHLYAALANRQSVSVVGPQLIGKSSLLQRASLPEMQDPFSFDLSRHIFVYLDLREYLHKTSEDFFHAVNKRIIAQSRRLSGLDLHMEGESEDKFSSILEQIVEQGFFPVLLLDAFDDITRNKHFDPEFFAFLRAQANRGKVSYVTASVTPLNEVTYRGIVDSPFFNIFYSYTLGPLAPEEARALITIPAEKVGQPFTEEEIGWVLKMAGRHPFFIQRICHYLFEEKLSRGGNQIDERLLRRQAYEDLRPHFQDMWECLSEEQRVLLQDEAQQKEKNSRALPELSESALFRQFVRDTCQVEVFKMTLGELKHALDNIDNAKALGETNLRLLNLVSQRLKMDSSPSVAERGMSIRTILKEAFERLRGPAVRNDSDPAWRNYNILHYRYFKYHLRNEQVAARLGLTSMRQYYRDRTKAIDALLNILLEMEKAAGVEE